ncbi:MAG: TerB family tellurite resistance protein [Rhodanobacteraceae bacterium]
MKFDLQNIFRNLAGAQSQVDDARTARLAVTQLLLEVARADLNEDTAEIEAVRKYLARAYKLDAAGMDELIASAKVRVEASVSLYDSVKALNGTMNADDKGQLMRGLWEVAYADGHLDPHEESLLRRLSDLLYVPHATFIREKLKLLGE